MTDEHSMYIWSVFILAIIVIIKELCDFGNFLVLAKKVEEAEDLIICANQSLFWARRETNNYLEYRVYSEKLEHALNHWSDCWRKCVQNSHATSEDITSAKLAAKEVVAICHEIRQAGFSSVDCEQIMARNLNMLNKLEDRRGGRLIHWEGMW